jgi:hypothetical protein
MEESKKPKELIVRVYENQRFAPIRGYNRQVRYFLTLTLTLTLCDLFR